ncbi:MAG: hypothetical protein M3N52_07605, partial [Actinomycetota bacterium]|nr:hypothetical protein [Actinomycetota bacterium]
GEPLGEAPPEGGDAVEGATLESLEEHPASSTSTDAPEAPTRRGTPAEEPEKTLPAHDVEDPAEGAAGGRG